MKVGTLRPKSENDDVNGRETETSFLAAVFRFWHTPKSFV